LIVRQREFVKTGPSSVSNVPVLGEMRVPTGRPARSGVNWMRWKGTAEHARRCGS
jgi:hypothetical protein